MSRVGVRTGLAQQPCLPTWYQVPVQPAWQVVVVLCAIVFMVTPEIKASLLNDLCLSGDNVLRFGQGA